LAFGERLTTKGGQPLANIVSDESFKPHTCYCVWLDVDSHNITIAFECLGLEMVAIAIEPGVHPLEHGETALLQLQPTISTSLQQAQLLVALSLPPGPPPYAVQLGNPPARPALLLVDRAVPVAGFRPIVFEEPTRHCGLASGCGPDRLSSHSDRSVPA